MKNYFSKSTSEFDFQKFFNLILTEQRAQRIDLARLIKLVRDMITNLNITEVPIEEIEEQPDDSSSRE